MTALESYLLKSAAHKSARAYPLVAEWLDERELEGKAARTLDGDERYTAALLRAYPDVELRDFTPAILKAFLTGVRPASRRKYAAHLTQLFKWAVINDHADVNPMDKVPTFARPKQKVVAVFNDAEVELLSADPLFLLLFDTGIRFGEARILQVKHFTFRLPDPETGSSRSTVAVLGKGNKGRVIPLTNRLVEALTDWFRIEALADDAYLWGDNPGGHYPRLRRTKPVGETALKTWYRKALEDAGVQYRKFHTTRHTFATRALNGHLASNGQRLSLSTVSRMLGHASIKTTDDEYAHLAVEDLAAELALLGV